MNEIVPGQPVDFKQLNTQPSKKMGFSELVQAPQYQQMIAQSISGQAAQKRFITGVISAVNANPKLQECSTDSILTAALTGEALGLTPSPQMGQYYIVPYGRQAQFQLGYKGYIQLAQRTGQYKSLNVMTVHEGEYLGRDAVTGEPMFSWTEDEDGPVIGYMAAMETVNGFRKNIYWSRQKMLNYADKYSAAFSSTAFQKLQNGEYSEDQARRLTAPWYTNFDDMAQKTVLKQLLSKWGILSTEMVEAEAVPEPVQENTVNLNEL